MLQIGTWPSLSRHLSSHLLLRSALAQALLILVAVTSACAGRQAGTADLSAVDNEVRVVLSVEPEVGAAPLDVVLTARLVGNLDPPERFDCPTLAWQLGNDFDDITRPENCRPGHPRRTFRYEYTYPVPGSYYASVRLLAVDVASSKPVQVLVRGATPTLAPVAKVPGPTIVIATPPTSTPAGTRIALAPRVTPGPLAVRTPEVPVPTERPLETPSVRRGPDRSASATATPKAVTASPAAEVTRTLGGTAPAARRAAPPTAPSRAAVPPASERAARLASPSAPSPRATGPARVLPADLYFVADNRQLMMLPADGGPPRRVTRPGELVDEFDVSRSGVAAYAAAGTLKLAISGAEPLMIAAAEAFAPVWSRDGRRLAYSTGTVHVYDMVGGRRTSLDAQGTPLAWSRSGRLLLVGTSSSALAIADVESLAVTTLPLAGGGGAGWLPDRVVVWLTGPGLRLLTIQDALLLTTLLPGERTSDAMVRPDMKLLVLVETPAGRVPHVIDLADDTLPARPFGPPIPEPEAAPFAWAPDGRHAAVGGPRGVVLLDSATGAGVPLVRVAVGRIKWVLPGGR